MKAIFEKTFGGLNKAYYFRQLFFGALIPLFFVFMVSQSSREHSIPVAAMFYFAVNTLLYPYSRFVWDRCAGFIMGNNTIVFALPLFFFIKVVSVAICWSAAIFIAPAGLVWLWWLNSRQNA